MRTDKVAPVAVLIHPITTALAHAGVDGLVGVIAVESEATCALPIAVTVVIGAVRQAREVAPLAVIIDHVPATLHHAGVHARVLIVAVSACHRVAVARCALIAIIISINTT